MRNKLRLNPDELRSAAGQARKTASEEVLTCPRADFASPPRTSTRRPRTSSVSPAYGSQESPYVYDILSPRRQTPSSPPAQLSHSISEIGGPAATKWDADKLHQYTQKGGEAARAAKTRGPVSRSSTLTVSALNSQEDAYRLLRENQVQAASSRWC